MTQHNTGSKQAKPEGEAAVALPKLGPLGMLRWGWTQLTSMRTALFLLLLLAIAALPGSIFPQRVQGTAQVTEYITQHPGVGEVMDWFKLFDVFSSPWFSAIYILLFISLIGCVVPRAKLHFKALRSQPPRTPRRLSRLPEYGALQIPADAGMDAATAVAGAAKALRSRGYRIRIDTASATPSVAGERGYAKESGNLLFHVSLIGVLVAVAAGGLFGYSGQRILVQGDTFVNSLVGYDQFNPGTNFDSQWLQPYSLKLDKFNITFDRDTANNRVQPLTISADVTVRETPGAPEEKKTIKVNDPLSIGGTDVYLLGNGYAPHFTVKDGNGKVAFADYVVGRLAAPDYTSSLTIKVPDAKPSQLAFSGLFLPSAVKDAQGVDQNSDPDPKNPVVLLNSYYGNLGLDSGTPQNVFVLDVSKLTPLNDRKLAAGGIRLQLGQTVTLPDNKGSITFDGLTRYAGVEIRHNPTQGYILIFAATALIGLIGSLFLTRRRAWVRVGNHPDGRVMVEYGLLARGEDQRLKAEGTAIRESLRVAWGLAAETTTENNKSGADASTHGQEQG